MCVCIYIYICIYIYLCVCVSVCVCVCEMILRCVLVSYWNSECKGKGFPIHATKGNVTGVKV
jgi:hypothetical protein